jgi:hypothetical protein
VIVRKPFIELTVVCPLQLEAELEMEDIMSLKDGLTKQEVSILPFIILICSKCMHERVDQLTNILASTSVPYRPTTLQVSNSALTWHETHNSAYPMFYVFCSGDVHHRRRRSRQRDHWHEAARDQGELRWLHPQYMKFWHWTLYSYEIIWVIYILQWRYPTFHRR